MSKKERLIELGATENEADRVIEAVTASATAIKAKLEDVFDAMTRAFEAGLVSFSDLYKVSHAYGLLYGSLRYRKPYLKQPGEQFARVSNGQLMQFKRLTDGTVVKV